MFHRLHLQSLSRSLDHHTKHEHKEQLLTARSMTKYLSKYIGTWCYEIIQYQCLSDCDRLKRSEMGEEDSHLEKIRQFYRHLSIGRLRKFQVHAPLSTNNSKLSHQIILRYQ